MNGLLLDALYAKYHAEKAEAVAKLNIYLSWSVGIGEHPQHTEEMDKLIGQFEEASGKLASLKNMLSHIANSNVIQDPITDKEINATDSDKEILND